MPTIELYLEDAYQRSAPARLINVDERGIQLDRTPFYALGGGQPGDRGWLDTAHGRISIDNTIRERASGEIILDSAVGHARVCVRRAGWLEPVLDPIGDATRPQGRPCNEEQQRQAARRTRNRVRSVLTQLVMPAKAPQRLHAPLSEKR